MMAQVKRDDGNAISASPFARPTRTAIPRNAERGREQTATGHDEQHRHEDALFHMPLGAAPNRSALLYIRPERTSAFEMLVRRQLELAQKSLESIRLRRIPAAAGLELHETCRQVERRDHLRRAVGGAKDLDLVP